MTCESMAKDLVTIHMKATKQNCTLVLSVILYKVVLTCDISEDDVVKLDHSNES